MATDLEPSDITLTCKGLSCVNWNCGDADFEFVAGTDEVCRVHTVLAEFLSSKVARIRKCEPFCYRYKFRNSELFRAFESLVSSLHTGSPLHVDKSNFVSFLRLSKELENNELLSALLGLIKIESFSIEDAILFFYTGTELGTACSKEFGSLGDFIASHFYEIDAKILEDLDLETAQNILANPSLKIEDEDSLYQFVRRRSETDLRFASLFEFVRFEYLTVECVENFASYVSEHLLDNISAGLWARMSSRFILDTKGTKKPPTSNAHHTISSTGYPKLELTYREAKPLDGIIAHLTRECGGNVHNKGIVEVTARTVYRPAEPPENVVDLNSPTEYSSRLDRYQWICYDFKERRVIPTSYTVKTVNSSHMDPDEVYMFGWCHLKSWVIKVSNDGRTWQTIDTRSDNSDLNRNQAIANFTVNTVPSTGFRYIRLESTGPNHRGDFSLNLSALEIFGTLS